MTRPAYPPPTWARRPDDGPRALIIGALGGLALWLSGAATVLALLAL